MMFANRIHVNILERVHAEIIADGYKEIDLVKCGAFKLPVPADSMGKVSEYIGKTVVFGMRPEDVHDRDYVPGQLKGAPVSATVDVMEPMGADIYLYLVSGKSWHVARVDPRSQEKPGKTKVTESPIGDCAGRKLRSCFSEITLRKIGVSK